MTLIEFRREIPADGLHETFRLPLVFMMPVKHIDYSFRYEKPGSKVIDSMHSCFILLSKARGIMIRN